MICPKCKELGLKSTVTSYGSMSTLMGYPTYYDEDGNVHQHDSNRVTSDYRCSEGHRFISERKGSPCPSYPKNCDFSGGEEKIRIID